LRDYFGLASGDDDSGDFKGWAGVAWSKPEGAKLDAVADRLKALKLTIRNAPLAQPELNGRTCLFTGEPAKESVLIGRSY
jgi:prolyl-tRNA synthetase